MAFVKSLKSKVPKRFTDFLERLEQPKHSSETPKGNPNIGNTCYINAVLQVLKWTPCFESRLGSCHTDESEKVASCLKEAMTCTCTDKMKLKATMKSLGTLIGRNTLGSGTPEDCYELYNTLLESLHSDNDGCPTRLFEGTFLMTYCYDSCEHIERQLQTFTSLSVPLMTGVDSRTTQTADEIESYEEISLEDIGMADDDGANNMSLQTQHVNSNPIEDSSQVDSNLGEENKYTNHMPIEEGTSVNLNLTEGSTAFDFKEKQDIDFFDSKLNVEASTLDFKPTEVSTAVDIQPSGDVTAVDLKRTEETTLKGLSQTTESRFRDAKPTGDDTTRDSKPINETSTIDSKLKDKTTPVVAEPKQETEEKDPKPAGKTLTEDTRLTVDAPIVNSEQTGETLIIVTKPTEHSPIGNSEETGETLNVDTRPTENAPTVNSEQTGETLNVDTMPTENAPTVNSEQTGEPLNVDTRPTEETSNVDFKPIEETSTVDTRSTEEGSTLAQDNSAVDSQPKEETSTIYTRQPEETAAVDSKLGEKTSTDESEPLKPKEEHAPLDSTSTEETSAVDTRSAKENLTVHCMPTEDNLHLEFKPKYKTVSEDYKQTEATLTTNCELTRVTRNVNSNPTAESTNVISQPNKDAFPAESHPTEEMTTIVSRTRAGDTPKVTANATHEEVNAILQSTPVESKGNNFTSMLIDELISSQEKDKNENDTENEHKKVERVKQEELAQKEENGKEESDCTDEDKRTLEMGTDDSEKAGKEKEEEKTLNKFLKCLNTPLRTKGATEKNSIETSLETFISEESYEEGTLHCRKCDVLHLPELQDGGKTKKRILIADPPPILALQLNRVRQVVRKGLVKLEKITDRISYPETLDISPYVSKFSAGKTNVLYQLYAVIVHHGGLGKGHYLAYIKVPVDRTLQPNQFSSSKQDVDSLLTTYESTPSLQANYIDLCAKEEECLMVNKTITSQKSFEWFKFNDSKVSECKNPPHGDNSLSDAYMLFYSEAV